MNRLRNIRLVGMVRFSQGMGTLSSVLLPSVVDRISFRVPSLAAAAVPVLAAPLVAVEPLVVVVEPPPQATMESAMAAARTSARTFFMFFASFKIESAFSNRILLQSYLICMHQSQGTPFPLEQGVQFSTPCFTLMVPSMKKIFNYEVLRIYPSQFCHFAQDRFKKPLLGFLRPFLSHALLFFVTFDASFFSFFLLSPFIQFSRNFLILNLK